MEYYFGESYKSGLSDLDISGDEEIRESLFPPPRIIGEKDEEDDETESMSTKNDHDQPGEEEGEEHQAAEHSASNVSEESEMKMRMIKSMNV